MGAVVDLKKRMIICRLSDSRPGDYVHNLEGTEGGLVRAYSLCYNFAGDFQVMIFVDGRKDPFICDTDGHCRVNRRFDA
jgi:hypothetical protein